MKISQLLRHLWIALFVSVIMFGTEAAAQVDDYVPQENRIKIDAVDASEAPQIQIRATFLDKKTLPVSPKKIDYIEVYADDEFVTAKPELTTLKDSDIPLDLALIVPFSKRFSDSELESMTKSMAHIIEQAREGDRVAGFFDDGRSIHVYPLGKADEVSAAMQQIKPKGQPSFLYSSLDKAIEEMTDPARFRNNARRAIILVTDAFDTYTFKSEDVQREILQSYLLAKKNNIHIYVVMYKPFIPSLIPLFEGLSRKTGGTYRYAEFAEQIAKDIDYAWGEIYGELIINFKQSGLRKGNEVVYRIEAMRDGKIRVQSEPSAPIVISDLKFDWKKFWIWMGCLAGVILIGIIILIIVRRRRKAKKEEEEALAEKALQEKIERGEACPKCRRTMLPEWKECMFCAKEAAAELTKQKEEQRKKALEEAEKKGIKLEGRVCPKCGRTLMPQWKECLFCKAGIGTDDSKPVRGMAPTRREKEKKQETGERVCPNCGRPMKSHWTVCLYCEADKSRQPVPNAAPKEEMKPAAPAARVCPNCGRPLKAHWSTCLYCEANKSRI